MEEFILRALLGGTGVALVAGPLGCFVIWRRMAYFGDSLAHSALLGIALGVGLGMDLNLGIMAAFVVFALLLVFLQNQQRVASDTLLGILSHGALSLGLVAISMMEGTRVDLLGYLFGDILAVTWIDLIWIYGGGAVALGLLAFIWGGLLAVTIHEELAQAEGVPVFAVRFVFMLLIALVIVIAMKIVGILLVTALLIIPAAVARRFARTPEQMAAGAAGAGVIAVVGGIGASLAWDTPSGPSVVLVAALMFLLSISLPGGRGVL
ncbi:MAG: metal ABC transporter permease [SAR324 cluster bacterium]|nr:metal ABC transporter permease [SAR324 cluster bacterium]